MALPPGSEPPAIAPRAGPSRRALVLRAGVGLATVLVSAVGGALLMHASIDPTQDPATGVEVRHEALAGVVTWGMQLDGLDVAEVARSPFDLVVIDELAGGARTEALARTVAALQRKPDGSRRLVLAHLAIGGGRTARGGHRVPFWDESWQASIVGGPSAVLQRVLEAGFDGVYLDHADVHLRWAKDRPGATDDLVAFVERISEHGREWRPGFIVTLQNPGSLAASQRIRAAVDAVARSDLLFEARAPHAPSTAEEIAAGVAELRRARRAGLPVLIVERVADPAQGADVRRQIEELGFLPYIAPRAADRPMPQD